MVSYIPVCRLQAVNGQGADAGAKVAQDAGAGVKRINRQLCVCAKL